MPFTASLSVWRRVWMALVLFLLHLITNVFLTSIDAFLINGSLVWHRSTKNACGTAIQSQSKRRPRGYWSNTQNVLNELLQFWADVNVPIEPDTALPPIPNESLLNHFRRHDLRWAIASQGGREALAFRLGGAPIIPGIWEEAVKVREVRMVLDPNNDASSGLSPYYPPISPQHKNDIIKKLKNPPSELNSKFFFETFKTLDVDPCPPDTTKALIIPNEEAFRFKNGRRWSHRKNRKNWGYWTSDALCQEM